MRKREIYRERERGGVDVKQNIYSRDLFIFATVIVAGVT